MVIHSNHKGGKTVHVGGGMNYYNEFDPQAAQWLRNLIDGGKIPQGHVDERSITEVEPDELKRYTQCHFFAGIGGWSYALELAGWKDDGRVLWTGSCPCQPFSTAGKQKGKEDERHLWPVWFDLIRSCRPDVVMGEQVAAAVGHGWLDGVFADMEGEGYACGAAIVPACAVNAPHRRERLWFVADTTGIYAQGCKDGQGQGELRRDCELNGTLANTKSFGCGGRTQNTEREGAAHEQIIQPDVRGEFTRPCALGNAQHDGSSRRQVTGSEGQTVFNSAQGADSTSEFAGASQSCNVADANDTRAQGHGGFVEQHDTGGWQEQDGRNTATGFWDNTEWLGCPDGKQRRVEPTIPLLVDGVPARVVKLRALGNAIVPILAAQIIKAFTEANMPVRVEECPFI